MGSQPGDESRELITVRRDGRWYVVTDEPTGISCQAETKAAALTKLARALQLQTPPESDAEGWE